MGRNKRKDIDKNQEADEDRKLLISGLLDATNQSLEKGVSGYVVCTTMLMVGFELNNRLAKKKALAIEVALRLLVQSMRRMSSETAADPEESDDEDSEQISRILETHLLH